MPYVPHDDETCLIMQKTVGINHFDELYDEMPNHLKRAKCDEIPAGINEWMIERLMSERAPERALGKCFLGGGAYEHYIPAIVWQLARRGEFYTSYTPYQAEASQGTLQIIYEYQTMMTRLMMMEISNASLYDGATALAEAAIMAMRIKENAHQILIPKSLHPYYRSVLKTFGKELKMELIDLPYDQKKGTINIGNLAINDFSKIAAIIIAQPNFWGCLEDTHRLTNFAHEKNILVIAQVNPLAMSIIAPPGEWGEQGADIVCGELQPFGIPLSYGGPYCGFLCTRKTYIRKMPGRIAGKTTDVQGRVGYVLTLQTREQHIRREKAISNICTNQGLLLTAATIYLSFMGGSGLIDIANRCHQIALKLYQGLLKIPGVTPVFASPFFHEFMIRLPDDNQKILNHLLERKIFGGIDCSSWNENFKNCILICVTETKTPEDCQKFLENMAKIIEQQNPAQNRNDLRNGVEIPQILKRKSNLNITKKSELETVRHFTRLSRRNFCIDANFYPLGSCTMKYNPRIADHCAMIPGFIDHHPWMPSSQSQGLLTTLYELQQYLKDIAGMPGISLSPMAGAQGEYAGVKMIAAYHQSRGEHQRREMLVADAAHGTNPASAALAGFIVKEIPTDHQGNIDLTILKKMVGSQTAGMMLTNPSTLGVFEKEIDKIADIVHEAGGLLYYDGANLNAILGRYRPGDMGFDVMHMNLHKTFATPHGGGGPGSGPIACHECLIPFLPIPIVMKEMNHYRWSNENDCPQSIGRLSTFMGNIGVLLRAYVYIRMLGKEGLSRVSQFALLNANYLQKRLEALGFESAFPSRRATHEFIITLKNISKKTGVTALDVAKRLLDYGIYAPTIYFPLLVPECLLIEPTETESKQELDYFIQTMEKILEEIHHSPELVRKAPLLQAIGRLDEVKAARELNVVEALNSQ